MDYAKLEKATADYTRKGAVSDAQLALLIEACKTYEMLNRILVGTVISDTAMNIRTGAMRLEDLQDRRKQR